jgi:anthranilate phosphoribosyltransferase
MKSLLVNTPAREVLTSADVSRTPPVIEQSYDAIILSTIQTIVREKRSLTREEARDVMARLLSGSATDAQISALLVALQNRGETADEIAGFAEAIREAALPLPGIDKASISSKEGKSNPFVDTCGTGGDRHGTFNISTVAAFVLAGAGVKVTKHGNRGISSRCGSADVLEALGVNISMAPESLVRVLDEVGIVFLFAPALHPAVKQIQRVRREIKVKSIFNILGPLTNPAQPSGQVVGVYSEQVAAALASALIKIGVSRAIVAHGSDGLDEITITGPTTIIEIRNDWMRRYHISPEYLGFKRSPVSAIAGGDALENSRIARNILNGERSPRRDIVLINAAAGLVVADKADSIVEALRLAEESVDSGRALKKMDDLVQFSRRF